jgi:hypothetical protein
MYTKHLTEVEPGIFVKENAKRAHVEQHYKRNAVQILKNDAYHYQCFHRRHKDAPIFKHEFYSVADVAGGHPKLASFMKISGEIVVYDQYASMYQSLHAEFLKHYPTETPIRYEKKQVTHPNFSPNAEVAILCHILEHLDLKQVRRLLGNLETDKVIVYGPNIEASRNEKWFHFSADHRTFATMPAMCRLVEEAGYRVKWATGYSEDYVIYGDK